MRTIYKPNSNTSYNSHSNPQSRSDMCSDSPHIQPHRSRNKTSCIDTDSQISIDSSWNCRTDRRSIHQSSMSRRSNHRANIQSIPNRNTHRYIHTSYWAIHEIVLRDHMLCNSRWNYPCRRHSYNGMFSILSSLHHHSTPLDYSYIWIHSTPYIVWKCSRKYISYLPIRRYSKWNRTVDTSCWRRSIARSSHCTCHCSFWRLM